MTGLGITPHTLASLQRFLPQVQARVFPVAEVRHSPAADISYESNWDDPHKLMRLKSLLESQWPDLAPRTVLYMMSGTDAATPLTIFPDAETYVHLDNHPFVSKPEMLGEKTFTGVRSALGYSTFRYADAIDREGSVAGRLAEIASREISGFRMLGVTAFTNSLDEFLRANDDQVYPGPDKPIHGWIDFDRGAGTPAQRLLHLQVILPRAARDDFDPRQTWWVNFLEALNPEALIVKAAASMALPGVLHDGFRELLENWLRAREGVLVEGLDQGIGAVRQQRYEFTGDKRSGCEPNALKINSIPYGYHRMARVERYQDNQ